VLEVLLGFVDFATGRCDPALDTLCAKAKRSRDTVVKAVERLRSHGFIDKVRRTRKTGRARSEGPQREQISNAYDLIDRHYRTDLGHQRIMRAAIEIGLLRHQHQIAADRLGLIHYHDVFDAARLGLARTGDDAGAPTARIGDHTNRPPPKGRIAKLFNAGKEAIKIKVEVFDRVRFSHGADLMKGMACVRA